jgi:hypothetical protein
VSVRPRLVAAPPVRLLLAALLGVTLLAAGETTWDFSDTKPGDRPGGFVFASTGGGDDGRWEVQREGNNHVLAHLGSGRARGYRMATVPGEHRDVMLSVRLRIAGEDRTAGIVWRYQDDGQYYLAQLDLRAQTMTLFRVVGGNRSRLEREDEFELDAAGWHTLKIEHREEVIRVWVNGVPVERARDRVIVQEGRVGVWLTAGSAAWFDDLRVAGIQR